MPSPPPLPVYGDGRQARDWLYVDDHYRAIDRVPERGKPGEVYTIGGNNDWYTIDIVNLIFGIIRDETGEREVNDSLIRFVTDRPGHVRRYSIDSSKILQELEWKPLVTFEEGIRSAIRWNLDRRKWTKENNFRRLYEIL